MAGAQELDEPVRFGGREFSIGVTLRIELLAPLRDGVELAPLVKRLDAFPSPQSWSARMRRALVPRRRTMLLCWDERSAKWRAHIRAT